MVPDTEGTQYKFYPEKNNRELIAGTSRVHTTDGAVEVDCKIGYYKNSSAKVYTVCSPEGTWEPKVDKLCHSKCYTLLSIYITYGYYIHYGSYTVFIQL